MIENPSPTPRRRTYDHSARMLAVLLTNLGRPGERRHRLAFRGRGFGRAPGGADRPGVHRSLALSAAGLGRHLGRALPVAPEPPVLAGKGAHL